uniref:Uncharacterized protein n=1 Tax=Anguilla anguilla TaxID=7936 RepID=A0A0E9TTM5_ANGAN
MGYSLRIVLMFFFLDF